MWAWVVCVGERREEGEGGVGDAGFVLHVAHVKNSSNTTNTTSQSVRWPPWLQPKIHPNVRVAKHASLLSVSMPVYISALSIPSLHPSSPPSPPIWLGWSSSPVRSTLKCRELERRGWVRINLKWSLHHPSAHLGTRPVQVVADRLIIKTLLF